MPFAIIGFLLGIKHINGRWDWFILLLVVLCMVFARSAAMAFNRLVDRKIDGKNPRTKDREIPAGTISIRAAVVFIILSCSLFIVSTWFINPLCFILSPVALAVILGYSYTKRFTSLSHFVLGLGLSLAPIGAYIAVTGTFHILPVLYSLVVLCWVAGFDIMYSIQDEEFDTQERLHSLPARFGVIKALWLSGLTHLISLGVLFTVGILGKNGIFFWAGAASFAVLLIYQHWVVRPGKLHRINRVFAMTNGMAGIVLAIFYILDWMTCLKLL